MQAVAEAVALADHEQMIVRLYHGVAGRDQRFSPALYRRNEKGRRSNTDTGDVPESMADDRSLFLHPKNQQFHAAFEKIGGFLRARRLDQPTDFLRHGLTRIDQKINADVLAGLHERRLAKVRLIDACDATGHAGLTRQKTGNQIDLVRTGDGDQHVCTVDVGILKHLGAGRVATESQNIQLLLHPFDKFGGVIDDDHIVLLADQPAGNVIADLPRAKDDDAHNGFPSVLSPSQPKPGVMLIDAARTAPSIVSADSCTAGMAGVVTTAAVRCQVHNMLAISSGLTQRAEGR